MPRSGLEARGRWPASADELEELRMFRTLMPFARGRLALGGDDVFSALQRDMNRLFDDVTRSGMPRADAARAQPTWIPGLDVKRTDAGVTLVLDAPGMDEKDLEIVVRDDLITLKGDRRAETTEKGEDWQIVERSQGRFERTLQLPFQIDDKKVEATYDKGVLTVRIAKPPEVKASETRIPIGGGAAAKA
jgi:HSP20 family protein